MKIYKVHSDVGECYGIYLSEDEANARIKTLEQNLLPLVGQTVNGESFEMPEFWIDSETLGDRYFYVNINGFKPV